MLLIVVVNVDILFIVVTMIKNKIIDHYKKASTRNESPLKLNTYEAPSYDYYFDKQKKGSEIICNVDLLMIP